MLTLLILGSALGALSVSLGMTLVFDHSQWDDARDWHGNYRFGVWLRAYVGYTPYSQYVHWRWKLRGRIERFLYGRGPINQRWSHRVERWVAETIGARIEEPTFWYAFGPLIYWLWRKWRRWVVWTLPWDSNCPHCGASFDEGEDDGWFRLTDSGSRSTPDGTDYWFEGMQTCPRCSHEYPYGDSSL